jgi:hypothetical protein
MKKYTLTEPVVFRDGAFKLTKDQLERRAHLVTQQLDEKQKPTGLYVPVEPIQFKAGEVIEVDELDKTYWDKTEEGKAELEARLNPPKAKAKEKEPAETDEEKAKRLAAEEEAKKGGGKK